MRDNTIGIIVVGLIAFLAIVVTGKWLLDKKSDHRRHEHEAACAPAPVAPGVVVVPGQVYPEYHRNQHFWAGYNDGWNSLPPRLFSREYRRGYEIGSQDRISGRPDYYDRNYPAGFNLRLPGFRLNIR